MVSTLPPLTLWEQFSVIGIIVLVFALFFAAAWKVFSTYRNWQSDEHNSQRVWQEAQTEMQREWQAEQNKIRDAEQLKRDQFWQDQVRNMSSSQLESDRATTNVLAKVIERMDALTVAITLHDERAKEAIKEIRK